MIETMPGKYFSLPFLAATRLFPSRTLEGLFELTWHPSRALNLTLFITFGTREKQRTFSDVPYEWEISIQR